MADGLLVRTIADGKIMVHVDSKHPAHRGMFKTLVLLKLETIHAGPVYFIVESCATFDNLDEQKERDEYFYEEGQCPTNFVQAEAIFTHDDDDPHGLFEHVRTVWLTEDYVTANDNGDGDAWLRDTFPETRCK